MELFTMLVNPAAIDAERTCESLREAAEAGAGKESVSLRCVPMPEGTGIVCEIGERDPGETRRLLAALSRAMAAAVMDAYEQRLVDRCIHKAIGEDDPEGAEEVRAQLFGSQFAPAEKLRKSKDPSYERRLGKLGGAIAEYLAAEKFLHVEGVLRFRAEPYLEELRDAVSYAADEWMMEKQYREFVALLKYFVYLQETKMPAAHVVHHGNHEFTLLNERMMPIDTRQMDQFVVELIDKDISCEDVIVSTLISVAPAKLYVHTRTPEEQVIKTILTIFEGRTELCASCSVCAAPLERSGRK